MYLMRMVMRLRLEREKTLTDKERKKMLKQLKKRLKKEEKKNLTEFETKWIEEKVFELEEAAR